MTENEVDCCLPMRRRLPSFLLAITIFGAALLPAVIGTLESQGERLVWTGQGRINTADFHGYLSLIEEVREGGILAHNLYSPEPHPAFQLRPIYTGLGLLGRVCSSWRAPSP